MSLRAAIGERSGNDASLHRHRHYDATHSMASSIAMIILRIDHRYTDRRWRVIRIAYGNGWYTCTMNDTYPTTHRGIHSDPPSPRYIPSIPSLCRLTARGKEMQLEGSRKRVPVRGPVWRGPGLGPQEGSGGTPRPGGVPGHPGGARGWAFFRVFNNSPSRDRSLGQIFGSGQDTPLGQDIQIPPRRGYPPPPHIYCCLFKGNHPKSSISGGSQKTPFFGGSQKGGSRGGPPEAFGEKKNPGFSGGAKNPIFGGFLTPRRRAKNDPFFGGPGTLPEPLLRGPFWGGL